MYLVQGKVPAQPVLDRGLLCARQPALGAGIEQKRPGRWICHG
jgi:hypothetical protein